MGYRLYIIISHYSTSNLSISVIYHVSLSIMIFYDVSFVQYLSSLCVIMYLLVVKSEVDPSIYASTNQWKLGTFVE